MAAFKSLLPLLFLLLATTTLILHTTTATPTRASAPPSPLLGGFTPIPIDHHVEELAKFAIGEHNKQAHVHLVYNKTLKAERQLVNGYNYRLVISAYDQDGVTKNYVAIVYVPFGPVANPKLTSFSLLGTPPAPAPAPPPIPALNPVDPRVAALGKFAVEEHNKQSNDHLIFSEVLRADVVYLNGVSYTLVISALQDGMLTINKAIVYVFVNKTELLSFTPLPPTGPVTIPGHLGGYEPITNVQNDTEVQELGRFAVQEYNNKFNIVGKLSFNKVVEAKKQIVAGTNYYLYISAVDNHLVADLFEVYLFQPLRGYKTLTSFKRHVFTDP